MKSVLEVVNDLAEQGNAALEEMARKAGRPRKLEEEKGAERITVRFTQAEFDAICREARERDLTLSEYIRERVFVGQKVNGPSPGPYYAG